MSKYLLSPLQIMPLARHHFRYALRRGRAGDLFSARIAAANGAALVGVAVREARTATVPTRLSLAQEEWDRRAGGVNATYDALDERYEDSISWNARGQSGSRGDYERARALAQLGPRPRS